MRNFIRFSGLTRVMHQRCSSTLRPPPICSSTCVLLLTLVLSYQPYSNFTPSGFNEVYLLHIIFFYALEITPHLRQTSRGEYTRKEWSLYNKDVKNKGCKDVKEI